LYNHRQFIGEAIESVLRSTVQNFEIIVVDDGSVDGSGGIVEHFDDKRISFIRQPNRGAHAAINRGVAAASAPWIAILNSDDRYHPSKLQQHLEWHEKNPGMEASASRIRYVSESGVPLGEDGYINWKYRRLKDTHRRLPSLKASLLVSNHLISTSALFVSRQSFQEIGGFLPLRYVHDWFCFLTLADRGRFGILEETLADYRVHGSNTIRENDERGRIEDNFVLEWHLREESASPGATGDILDLFGALKKNRRTSYSLLLLFQRWRQANNNDLAKCIAIFEDPDHPLMQLALTLVRRENGLPYYLKARLRRALGENLWFAIADHAVKGSKILHRWRSSGLSPNGRS
jgi:glycosyltransferase involved in cell wall biosynthesis